jgi:chemotaxis protein methyltransferase CheR
LEYPGPEIDEQMVNELAKRLKAERGIDLVSYKPRVLARRLKIRLRTKSCKDITDYLEMLNKEPEEIDELLKAMNINVSGFFRNPETFKYLGDHILPGLIEKKKEDKRGIHIISAGCAEGEEPYSFSILLEEKLKNKLLGVPVKIVGIDIEQGVLEKARLAVYKPDRMRDLPGAYKKKYFTQENGGFKLSEKIVNSVKFVRHDIRMGIPDKKADLIMCRNVLIYFRQENQMKIIKGFSEGLVDGGYLCLGKTENLIGKWKTGFKVVDISEHIYQKAGEEPCGWR